MEKFKFICFVALLATFVPAYSQEPQPDTTIVESPVAVPCVPQPDAAIPTVTIPVYYFMPAIYESYHITLPSNPLSLDSIKGPSKLPAVEGVEWFAREAAALNDFNRMRQDFLVNYPQYVRYNEQWMPEPPKKYHAVIDPSTHLLTIEELTVDKSQMKADGLVDPIKPIHWIHGFDGALQFSQAYLSQNWYQGGNNNVNMLVNAAYDIKLNQAYHPNLLFETSVVYKLSMHSTPEDSIHRYNISEDLLQINSKFGVKAAKRWFYSLSLQFKTQLCNSYNVNAAPLRAAFMSPGELNVGVGMTYNYESPGKSLKFDASIAPFSYNLKTCINSRIDPTTQGIEPGHKVLNQYGSSAELKTVWKMTRNITYTGRLFIFTDYKYAQGDFENTVQFTVNRFISTQVFAHLRYDSSTARVPGCSWDRWQFKEILSLGFAYKFSMS